MNLVKNAAAQTLVLESTAGTTDIQGVSVVDMQGFDGCLFLGILNTVTAAGVVRMWPMHSDSTSTTDQVATTAAAGIAGTTASTTSHTGQVIMLDVAKPQKRYLSVYVDRATQASEINVIALPYSNHKGAISQSTGQYGVLDPTLTVSPTT